MSNYTTISIDSETKKRVAKKAKKDRMSVSVIARILLNDYADGKITIGSRMLTENGFTPEQEAAMLRDSAELMADLKAGKVKSYASAEEMKADILNDPDV